MLAVFRVGHADHLHVADAGTGIEKFFNLARVNVLAAADDYIFGAAGDFAVVVGVHGGEVTAVQPAGFVDGVASRFGIFVVALHHQVAAGAEFARRATGHDRTGDYIHDFYFRMGQGLADRRHAQFQRVVHRGLRDHRRGFGQSVGNGHLFEVHQVHDALHHLNRTRRAGHDSGAQRAEIETQKLGMVQFRNEHGGNAVQNGATLSLDGFEGSKRIEESCRDHHRRAGHYAGQIAQHHSEAVVEGHRDTEAVAMCELHRGGDQ